MNTLIVHDHFEPYYAGRESSDAKPGWVKSRVPRQKFRREKAADGPAEEEFRRIEREHTIFAPPASLF